MFDERRWRSKATNHRLPRLDVVDESFRHERIWIQKRRIVSESVRREREGGFDGPSF